MNGGLVHRPGTLQEASEVTRAYQEHYNWQRPHQGRSCHNVPPRIAHPDLPHLPALPASVDPDRWVDQLHERAYVRHVGADGCVTVDERSYYVGLDHKGKSVALLVNAPGRCFEVWEGRSLLKRLPIKGEAVRSHAARALYRLDARAGGSRRTARQTPDESVWLAATAPLG